MRNKILIAVALLIFLIVGISYGMQLIAGQTVASGATIDYITIHVRGRIETTNESGVFVLRLRTEGSNLISSANKDFTTSWAEYTHQIDVNPDDSEAWEDTDLDGVTLDGTTNNIDNEVQIAKQWLVVTWTDASTDTYLPNGDFSDGSWKDQDAGGDLFADIADDSDATYIKNANDWAGYAFLMEDPT
jgi:hypothetical protein